MSSREAVLFMLLFAFVGFYAGALMSCAGFVQCGPPAAYGTEPASAVFDFSKDVGPLYFRIYGHHRKLVDINMETGAVTIDPGYTPDQAAAKFWRSVAHMYPYVMRRRCRGNERP